MHKTPLTRVRRQNREVTDEFWIQRTLTESASGVLAVTENDQPYVHANLFIYDAGRRVIYFHTAAAGHLRTCVENNPKASFIVFEMGRLLPGPRALDFSVEYGAVVVFGAVTVVTEPDEIVNVFKMYFSKYAPHIPADRFAPFTLDDAQRTTVYKLHIAEWSAKQHFEANDFPNAYYYQPQKIDPCREK